MARFCSECGKEIAMGSAFCSECGAKSTTAEQTSVPYSPPVVQRSQTTVVQSTAEQTTVGTGMYFILMLLFALPVVGFVACIISAFASRNKNIRNFARAMLIWLILSVVLLLILALVGYLIGGTLFEFVQQAGLGEFGDLTNDFSQMLEGIGQFEDFENLAEQLQNGELESITDGLAENNF